MTAPANSDRAYWTGVLTAGGATRIPRWTRDPRPGMVEHTATLPVDLDVAVRRLAAELAVPLGAVHLAAHAKVLAALANEPDVTTGYVAAPGSPPLPCRLSTDPATWRELLHAVHRAETELLAHRDFPVDWLRAQLGRTEPGFEVVFDPVGDGELTDDAVLRVGVHDRALRLRYRTDVLDREAVARVAGYHIRALELMIADPDAQHRGQTLLSAEERRFQLEGLAGPRRELPDLRCHELFEQRVRRHPDTVAAVHAGRAWTYRELNARANRLARALLARGLGREDVVAVVTERNLDWLVAVLAIFKAGGAYLPIEPHFPADRITTMLTRAECRLVLTEPGSTTTLDKALDALPHVSRILVDTAYAEDHAETDLGIPVAADQLAYIYFTSGSTGEPKGAMCEHAGMLNHLFAKIDDLGVAAGQVVAQTAPQCFDISLWQLVSALLVGGRTVIIPQDVILDVPRFVDTVVDNRVNVLQLVPSYLEAVLSYLEQHPRELRDLRCVSATGEALKMELVQRFFAVAPQVKLVNAYGLTETSDDTNHEVMDRPPDGDRVPLGRCVNNVRAYVVDEDLNLVPLGAPGEIVFSGICVGRGYVNDPERTRQAFLTDPYRPGQRLYRSGDHGRWRPDGKLEFLGRRDAQVKISGFRIEIGEVENALLRVPGVRDGAVVVAERPDQSRYLVAFYTGPRPVPLEEVRSRMGAFLAPYMIPAAFQWAPTLPLTPNGKIDKKKLAVLARDVAPDDVDVEPPGTPTEQRLADAWAAALGIPRDRIGRGDHFFDRGGTSLAAVHLAISLNRAVSLAEIIRHPVLADLAVLIDGDPRRHALLHATERSASVPSCTR